MKLICPACGAACAAEAWANDAEARQALRLVSELPESVSRRALGYLALFRPPAGRGLRWERALKLLSELAALVREPYVQWEGRPARPNEPRLWGQALERLIEKPPGKLPLASHGYLRAMVYDLAEAADRSAEAARNRAEAAGGVRRESRAAGGPERISYEELVRIRELKLGKAGTDPQKKGGGHE